MPNPMTDRYRDIAKRYRALPSEDRIKIKDQVDRQVHNDYRGSALNLRGFMYWRLNLALADL